MDRLIAVDDDHWSVRFWKLITVWILVQTSSILLRRYRKQQERFDSCYKMFSCFYQQWDAVLPEHVPESLQHAFLGFSLLLLLLPSLLLLLLLLLLFLWAIGAVDQRAFWAEQRGLVGHRGHRLSAWSWTLLRVFIHWRDIFKDAKAEKERETIVLTNRNGIFQTHYSTFENNKPQ